MALQVGSPAPPFKANAYFRQSDQFKELSLDDYRDKWLCLYFFPMAFSPLCPTEIIAFDDARQDFQDCNCELVACSTDSFFVHKAWCHGGHGLGQLGHPILSDITKRISMDYGVLLPDQGVALRGTFLVDPKGLVRWSGVNELTVGRNVRSIKRELDALQVEGTCPCNWEKGDPPAAG